MHIRKTYYFLLASMVLLLAIQPVSGQASPANTNSASPRLGSEIVISALQNSQFAPALAYNSQHNEYLVVWHNNWGGGQRDVQAARISSRGRSFTPF